MEGVVAAGRRYSFERHLKMWVYTFSDCKNSPLPRYQGEFENGPGRGVVTRICILG